MPGNFVAEIVRITTQCQLDVRGSFSFGYNVNEWVIWLQFFLGLVDLFADRCQHCRGLAADTLLEAPSIECQNTRLLASTRLVGIVIRVEFALENLGVEVRLFFRQGLELEATTRAEV